MICKVFNFYNFDEHLIIFEENLPILPVGQDRVAADSIAACTSSGVMRRWSSNTSGKVRRSNQTHPLHVASSVVRK